MTGEPAQVVVIADGGDAGRVLPSGHTLAAAGYATASDAIAHVSELRARSLAAVLVLGATGLDVTGVVMEVARRFPEVPVIVASHAGQPAAGPSRAVVRAARSEALETAVRAALRAASQRARVRTTLDRLNVRLRVEAPPDPPQQRRLVLSGLYLAAILEQAGDGIFVADRAGVVALWTAPPGNCSAWATR